MLVFIIILIRKNVLGILVSVIFVSLNRKQLLAKNTSLYRRLFDQPLVCPKCACSFKWAINPVSEVIYCYNEHPNDPADICGFTYTKEQVFTPEKLIIFNRLVAVCRLFSVR